MATTTTGDSDTSQSKAKSRSALKRAGSSVLNSLLRRADIKSVSIDRLDADTLTVEELAVGSSSVETIAISNIQTTIDTRRALLNRVRAVVSNQIRVIWEAELPWPFSDRSDDFVVGFPFEIPFPPFDVEIPDLDNIDVSVPTAQVSDTIVNIPPVTNLSFNGGIVSDIAVSDIQLPTGGYGLAGMAFDTFSLSHIGVPDAGITSVSVGSIEPNGNITLPSISTDLISIADIQVPSIQSNSPITVSNASAESEPRPILSIRLPFSIRITLSVAIRATFDMNINSFTLEEMEATSTIDSVSLQNIQFPFKATGVQMTGIGAKQLRAEEVSL